MNGYRRFVAAAMMTALLAVASSPVFAGEEVRLTGWITCGYCGKANANPEGKACALACAKKGARLLLFSDDRLYLLSDQDLAREHVGHEVVVTGRFADDGTLRVGRIEKKKETRQDQPAG